MNPAISRASNTGIRTTGSSSFDSFSVPVADKQLPGQISIDRTSDVDPIAGDRMEWRATARSKLVERGNGWVVRSKPTRCRPLFPTPHSPRTRDHRRQLQQRTRAVPARPSTRARGHAEPRLHALSLFRSPCASREINDSLVAGLDPVSSEFGSHRHGRVSGSGRAAAISTPW